MAKPRIFISSTFFDLRQVRADIERFIKELGYESVLNETGGIPYGKEEKLEEYCYKEISEVDILVGIVGGRFGSKSDHENYSVTQTEIKTAILQNKNVYIFIEKNVLAEYETYLLNKENSTTKYKFVNDIRIYKFIEEIFSLPKNNVIHPFETANEIVGFLKEQWAGLFKDLLRQKNNKGEYDNISQKVNELNEVASTMKTYLENVLKTVTKEKSQANSLISKETVRLSQFRTRQKLLEIGYIKHLLENHKLTMQQITDSLINSATLTQLRENFRDINKKPDGEPYNFLCMLGDKAITELNAAREILKLPSFEITEAESKEFKKKRNELRAQNRNKNK